MVLPSFYTCRAFCLNVCASAIYLFLYWGLWLSCGLVVYDVVVFVCEVFLCWRLKMVIALLIVLLMSFVACTCCLYLVWLVTLGWWFDTSVCICYRLFWLSSFVLCWFDVWFCLLWLLLVCWFCCYCCFCVGLAFAG